MGFKVHSENRCPVCGRQDSAHRIRRGWMMRRIRPNAALMKCRLCLTRYLIRKEASHENPPDGSV